jgi:hypothetical protein
MGMEKRTLGHLPHNLPQLGCLHTFLRQTKHHSWVYVGASFLRKAILEFRCPYRPLFLVSNSTDDLAGFFG